MSPASGPATIQAARAIADSAPAANAAETLRPRTVTSWRLRVSGSQVLRMTLTLLIRRSGWWKFRYPERTCVALPSSSQ